MEIVEIVESTEEEQFLFENSLEDKFERLEQLDLQEKFVVLHFFVSFLATPFLVDHEFFELKLSLNLRYLAKYRLHQVNFHL